MFGRLGIMLYRHKFITNSSSTGFIAWGVEVPASAFPTLPDEGEIIVRYVSDSKRFVCVEKSLKILWSEEDDDIVVNDGIYPLELENGRWRAHVTVRVQPRRKEPEGGNYDPWERALHAFLKEHDAFDLKTYLPKWFYVRVRE
jgi:hypothetical protein